MAERTGYTIKEAARLLNYSTDAIYKAISTGQGALADALQGRWQRNNKRQLVIYLDAETIERARRQAPDQPDAPLPQPPASSADQQLIGILQEQIAELRTRAERAEAQAAEARQRADHQVDAERQRADAERARLTATIEKLTDELTRRKAEEAQPVGLLARIFGRR